LLRRLSRPFPPHRHRPPYRDGPIVDSALDKLPNIYRTALILFKIEDLPGNEIAELVGIDVETLWVRLHRGRAKLLALMSKESQP
jgi:DNA-directed RNA polymerase specialized sigma24 family protein